MNTFLVGIFTLLILNSGSIRAELVKNQRGGKRSNTTCDGGTVRSLKDDKTPHCWFWKNEQSSTKVYVDLNKLELGCTSRTLLEGMGMTSKSFVEITKKMGSVTGDIVISIPEIGVNTIVFEDSHASLDIPETSSRRAIYVSCERKS
ncbi:MAG: hypothetical protein KDD34_01380 [Bdellovibrionales bacterium]|nr:hypothetical protein [Bdellovibrionales bacterium]